jgi:hypothetical protein
MGMGARALEKLVRLGGRATEVRLSGRADELARELGRDMDTSDSALAHVGTPRLGRGPNEIRLTPDVLRRGTWRLCVEATVGVLSSPPIDWDELATELGPRWRARIMELDGRPPGPTELRGDDMADGVAGSFDLARWTRSSRRCIWAVRFRMCDSEFDPGVLLEAGRVVRVVLDAGATGAVVEEEGPMEERSRADPVVAERVPDVRLVEVMGGRMRADFAAAVTAPTPPAAAACWSIDCMRVLRSAEPAGAS